MYVTSYVGVKLGLNKLYFVQVSHLKLHSEMMLLKVNLLLGRNACFKSIISLCNQVA